jgi:signal transduction histidine kinase
VRAEHDAIVLAITDDGRGFGRAQTSGGRGFANIRRRARKLGGYAQFLSEPGQGSTVRVRVPYRGATEEATPQPPAASLALPGEATAGATPG